MSTADGANSEPLRVPLNDQLGLDPERAAFEAWAAENRLALNRHRASYAATSTAWCWDAWRAGRAAERERLAAKFMADAQAAHARGNYVRRDEFCTAAGMVLKA